MSVWTTYLTIVPATIDQLGTGRPANSLGDIGAYEYLSPLRLGDLDCDGMDDAFE